MKYSNDLVDGERIYRKVFELKENKKTGKWKKWDGKEVTVTCACAQIKNKKFYGFSIQSPVEKEVNRSRPLSPARGRLRKAIDIDRRIIYPEQKWINRDQILSFVDEIVKKRKNWNGKTKVTPIIVEGKTK